MKNLNELYNAMKNNDESVLDQHGQWKTDLPVFGGSDVNDTGVWSWDADHMIVGTNADDLRIENR